MQIIKRMLVLPLFVGSMSVYAQSDFRPGYIVTTIGDTLRGEVDSRSDMRNTTVCRFRPATDAAVVEYTPPQLLGYGLTGALNYRTLILPNAAQSAVFMRVAVTGALSLYQIKDQQNNEAYYAQKGSAAVRPLIQRDTTIIQYNPQTKVETKSLTREYPFRSVLWEMMTDCPSVQTKLTKLELTQTQLINAITAYNACVGGTTYVAAIRKSKIRPLVLAGAYQAKLNYSRGGEQTLHSSAKPTFGVGVEIQPSKFNEHLSLLVQALYTKAKYHTQYQGTGSLGSGYEYTADINASAIQLPLVLRYSLTKGLVRPYFQAGAFFALNVQSQAQQTDFLPRLNTKVSVQEIELRSYGLGVTGSAGLLIPTGKAGSVNVEVRVGSSDNTSAVRGLISGGSSLSLLAGYTFGK